MIHQNDSKLFPADPDLGSSNVTVDFPQSSGLRRGASEYLVLIRE